MEALASTSGPLSCPPTSIPAVSSPHGVLASQSTWRRILPNVPEVEDATDFFKSGAASVDVVRSG